MPAPHANDSQRTTKHAPAREPAPLSPDAQETVPPAGGNVVPAALASSNAPPGYEIEGELGRGGMGVVYKARQEKLKRIVALKMILSGGHAGVDERMRFLAEAEAIAAIQHPGIVQIHEFGTHEGLPFFALEFCVGGSLASKLNGTPLPPRESAQLVEQIARAMQAAHERGIIHRDLKPANVLLAACGLAGPSTDFTPKITDFGLARRVEGGSGLTQTGAIMGTPSYMAPEQAEGKKGIGPAADVYALGAILYEMLTGRPPFRAATSFDTIMQVVADDPVPPAQLNARVPRDLETVCLRCLRKEPGKRYVSAADQANDLGRWQRGEPVQARPVGMSERAVKWARRRPAVAGLLAAIVVLTATALAVTTGLYRHAAWEAERALKAEKAAGEERDHAQEQEGIARRQEELTRQEKNKTQAEKDRAEEELTRAERLLYASQIQSAQREWEAGNTALAWEHLESCRWDYRDLEYRYLFNLFNQNHVTLTGHSGVVQSVAISSDGGRIVSGSWDKTVKVWDARTGKELLTLKGHSSVVNSVAISRDGGRIVSGSGAFRKAGDVKVWDARSGKELLSLKGHSDGVWSVAISSDGGRIVSGSSDGTVKVWDARSGKELLSLKGHTNQVLSVAISSDGGRIVSGSYDDTVKVWDARTGKDILTIKGHSGVVNSVAISNDGERIVSGSGVFGKAGDVKVWDARTGKDLLTLKGHTNQVHSVAISSDGGRIVSGSNDGTVKVWDVRSGKELLTLKGHSAQVSGVAISSDGGRIVSGSNDKTVKVWDARTGKDLLTLRGHSHVVRGVAISSDGGRIVSGSYDRTPKVWDARTGKELLTLKGHSSVVSSVAISSGGGRIVSGSYDDTVKVWDARTGKDLLTLKGHSGGVTSVAISSDGGRIVSGSGDFTVKVWDVRSGKDLLTLTGHSGGVTSVAISSDGGRIVSGSWDKTVKVWDARTGKELLTLKGHTSVVNSVAVSSDGGRIVSGSNDNTVKVWDARTGKDVLTAKGLSGWVSSVAISTDGKHVFAQDAVGKILAWDSVSGKLLASAPAVMPPGGQQASTPDGKLRVSIENGSIRVYRAELEQARKQREARDRELLERLTRFDPDWHREQLEESLRMGDDFAAAFHVERLLREQGWDASLHVLQAHLLARLVKRQESATHLAQALLLNPRVSLWPIDDKAIQRGEEAARSGDWPRAAREFRLAAHQPKAPALSIAQLVLAQAAAGDTAGTQQTVAELAERLAAEKDPREAFLLLDVGLSVPCPMSAASIFVKQARRDLGRMRSPITYLFLGCALYRAGQYAEAERMLAESTKLDGKGGFARTWMIQAMMARQLGKHDEAREFFARYERWHNAAEFPSWFQRTFWGIQLKEARKLISTPPVMPGVAQGE